MKIEAYLKETSIEYMKNETEDESLMYEFIANKNYYMLEFFNDGDIVFLERSPKEINVWDLKENDYLEFVKSRIKC